MHPASIGRRPWATAAIMGLMLLSLAGCTSARLPPVRAAASSSDRWSHQVTATAAGTARPPVGTTGSTACEEVPVVEHRHLLSLRDVWGSDNGGIATTELDLTECSAEPFAADGAGFVCRLPFPWLTGAELAARLHGLGALAERKARLVSPTGDEVTETVVAFPDPSAAGSQALTDQARDCGGGEVRVGQAPVRWSSDNDSSLAVATVGSSTVAVQFAGHRPSRAWAARVVGLAISKAATG